MPSDCPHYTATKTTTTATTTADNENECNITQHARGLAQLGLQTHSWIRALIHTLAINLAHAVRKR